MFIRSEICVRLTLHTLGSLLIEWLELQERKEHEEITRGIYEFRRVLALDRDR